MNSGPLNREVSPNGSPLTWREWVVRIRSHTPARLLADRSGPSYRTHTQLELRRDHAAAQDAVLAEFSLASDFPSDVVERFGLFEVQTRASSKPEHLLRPDLGRLLSAEAEATLKARCVPEADLQVVLGDGLSAAALRAQGALVLADLTRLASEAGWKLGQAFFVRYCRVGVMNEVGRILQPAIVVLLVGERPGLATAESLSAYLAWRPSEGHTDAHRNLISNIHDRGLPARDAARRILALADSIRKHRSSGPSIKEGADDGSVPKISAGSP